MSSSPTRDPYFRTCGGTDLQRETYWVVKQTDQPDYCFRFVEVQDTPGGLAALIQDDTGYMSLDTGIFDQDFVEQLTDPEIIALAMLSIHG